VTRSRKTPFASRAGVKLDAALDHFCIDVTDRLCADLGSHAGGFVEVLLKRGAKRVYAVETGYGLLEYRLRRDPRVVLRERTNALHVELPEPVSLVTIDVGWTKQERILASARRLLAPGGHVVSLVKPQYEADAAQLRGGILTGEQAARVFSTTKDHIAPAGWELLGELESPLRGHAGNVEFLVHLHPVDTA